MDTERSLAGAVIAGVAIAVALVVFGLGNAALHTVTAGLAALPH